MKRFWVLRVQGRQVGNYIHYNLADAEREAERLARLPENRGHWVALLEAVEFLVAPPLIEPPVERFKPDAEE